jgi:DNA (cytosine-5)-methyltransferase 1
VPKAYYNEWDKKTAAWLRELIKEGLIADGDVDERSITEVQGGDLDGYIQCHFFAGIGGWSYALRLAGWADDRPVWTGSCPCQDFSNAGRKAGFEGARDLWPEMRRLIAECKPDSIFGEQVDDAPEWYDRTANDLEVLDYACGSVVVPACSVGAKHDRYRLWYVADSKYGRMEVGWGAKAALSCGSKCERVPSSVSSRMQVKADAVVDRRNTTVSSRWDYEPRRVSLADGVSSFVGLVRGYGNAIVPQVAAEVIRAYMEITA